MSTKFGLLIDFDLLQAAISSNAKPEIVFSVHGRHLDKAIWRYMSAVGAPFGRNSSGWCRTKCRLRENGRNRNQNDTSVTAMRSKLKLKKSDGLKARNFSLVVQACKPGCYSYVEGCVLAGVEQLPVIYYLWYWHTIRTASQTNLQPCRRNGRQHLAKTIRVK